jgi:type IV pilus assembly protein PilN
MIRVNLIAGERRAAKAAGRSMDIAQRAAFAGTALLIVTAIGVGWRYWSMWQAEAGVENAIAAAKREEARLAEVLKQVADFDAQREELQRRVTLIDELRRGQNAPVHIVDEISRSLPEMTWLTNLKQEGYDVTLQGRCLSLTALSDFVGNLEATRYFKKPVEIVSSEVVKGDKDGPELISFTVKGTFQMSGIDQQAPPSKPGKKPAPAAKRGARG